MIAQNSEVYNPPTYLFHYTRIMTIWKKISVGGVVYLFRPNPNYLRISVLETKKKASPNGEGSRDLQIYNVFVANRFHCHPFAWPFHCG